MTPPVCLDCAAPLRSWRRPDIPGARHAAHGRCTTCYTRHHRRHPTHRQATPTACTDCHSAMRPARRPDLPGKPHAARGLCTTCYQRRRRPRHRRVVADVVEDYQFMRASGETFERAAERLGYTPAALRVKLRRAS